MVLPMSSDASASQGAADQLHLRVVPDESASLADESDSWAALGDEHISGLQPNTNAIAALHPSVLASGELGMPLRSDILLRSSEGLSRKLWLSRLASNKAGPLFEERKAIRAFEL